MKAILCKAFGGPETLVMEDLPEPEPGPDEVVIRVSAAALNFFDTLMLRNKYQFKPELPFSPGAEVAGRIEKLGNAVEGFNKDGRVLAFIRCNGCRELALAKAIDVIPVPGNVADTAAASLTVTYGTALHGLKDRGRLKQGESLAVLGASGGAGLAAVQTGKLLGARVIAAASSAEKLAICREHGADELINYREQDLREALRQVTGGRGADVIYDCVGGPHAEPALRSIAWEGRFLVIGFAAGDIPRIPLNLALLKGCDIVGVFWGRWAELNPEKHRANMEQLLAWVASGVLRPHIHGVFPLERTGEAIALLDKRQSTGKVIIAPSLSR